MMANGMVNGMVNEMVNEMAKSINMVTTTENIPTIAEITAARETRFPRDLAKVETIEKIVINRKINKETNSRPNFKTVVKNSR
jgi:hypothetical protein